MVQSQREKEAAREAKEAKEAKELKDGKAPLVPMDAKQLIEDNKEDLLECEQHARARAVLGRSSIS